ncbi:hypothetical protein [Methylomonas koyamae]|uniref:hypothetical protein n=1 Tax=Methylomonas koyamae TaxID=702114 RepID=UPI000A73EEEA|nr:hypothetical protein [Methylomonas koyamae]
MGRNRRTKQQDAKSHHHHPRPIGHRVGAPRFHPYFSITPNSFLDIGDSRIDIASLPHDSMRAYPAAAPHDPVKLSTEEFAVSMACEISPLPQPIALAFGIWSDKKAEYVCIEPIIGKQLGSDGLPTPLALRKSEELVLAFTIHAYRLMFAKKLSNLKQ